jgi:hypothetical protein
MYSIAVEQRLLLAAMSLLLNTVRSAAPIEGVSQVAKDPVISLPSDTRMYTGSDGNPNSARVH